MSCLYFFGPLINSPKNTGKNGLVGFRNLGEGTRRQKF